MCHTHQLAQFRGFNTFQQENWITERLYIALHGSQLLHSRSPKIPKKSSCSMALALFKLPDWMAQNKGEKDWVPTSVIFKGRVACAGVAFVNLPGPNGLLQPVLSAVHLRMKSQTLEPSMRSMWVCLMCSESSSFWNFISSVGHSLHQPRWHGLSTPISADLAALLAIQASSETSVHGHEFRLQV